MAIIRSKHESRYTVIDNRVFADHQLSFEAMGLLSYLLSKPDSWNVSVAHLAMVTEGTDKQSKRDALLARLKELCKTGFVVRKKLKTGEVDYLVFDYPQTTEDNTLNNNLNGEIPSLENPIQGKSQNRKIPPWENPTLVNTDNKELVNTEDTPLTPQVESAAKVDLDANAPVAANATTVGVDDSVAGVAQELPETQPKAAKSISHVPCDDIFALYNEILGDVLPKAQLLTDSRKRAMTARWKQMINSVAPSGKARFNDRDSGLAWFGSFFRKVKLNPHWVGGNDRSWRADLDWILKPSNFIKILEWHPIK